MQNHIIPRRRYVMLWHNTLMDLKLASYSIICLVYTKNLAIYLKIVECKMIKELPYSLQCAAVKTHWCRISTPPHTCRWSFWIDTTHSLLPFFTSLPPTIDTSEQSRIKDLKGWYRFNKNKLMSLIFHIKSLWQRHYLRLQKAKR